MDVKKWCKFNFKRGETGGGHCTNESCRFLHPDPPRSRDDPKWCADDHREDGGCLDFDCPLYHLRSCYKSQIKHFMKVRRSHEQSPQISRRIGGPSYEIDIKLSSSNKPKFRKRSFEKLKVGRKIFVPSEDYICESDVIRRADQSDRLLEPAG